MRYTLKLFPGPCVYNVDKFIRLGYSFKLGCPGLSSDSSSSPIVSTSVGQWLSSLGLADYESLFINYGFDDLEFIVSFN